MDSIAFLDASYAIALAIERDQHHEQAFALIDQLAAEATRVVTTSAVILEIGNHLSSPERREWAVGYIRRLQQDRSVEIVAFSDELFQQAFGLYRSRPDKDWGLTDCLSFVVTGEHGLTDALTADLHFEQAGFRALLRV